jgi:predicted nuclease of restriction endonuclease-like (RecB) superfamily
LLYPQIRQTVFGEFERLAFEHHVENPIWGTLTPKLQLTDNQDEQIRQTASAELQPIWGSLTPKLQQSDYQEITIEQSLNAELSEEYPLSPYQLLSRLSFTHFVELIQVEDNLQRLFYEVEAIKNNWSVRELARAIDTSLAFRTSLSTDKKAIIKKIKNLKPTTTAEIMRNPVVLEFLDLEEKTGYSETDLETAILNHLQKFLIELGTGFCFEARQKRITFDNEHYRIDLVFYHRILKSHILIDLKIGKFDHADAGQMNVYLNYYKENEMCEGDNPPVGLILCGNKKETLARYATTGIDNQMFVSQYLLKLPDKKLLESFIRNEIKNNE